MTERVDRPAVAVPVQGLVRRTVEALRAWRRRRYWTAERQLEHLRVMVMDDWRWLAHDPVADAMATRYKRALSQSWYQLQHEDAETFRRRIGLCPHEARRQRQERGEPAPDSGRG